MSHTKRIIVAGGGRVGFRTARELAARGHDVVLIEKEAERSDHATDERVAMVIEGDATSPAVLEQADPERADAIAALTDEAGTNLAICLAARQVAPSIRTLARTDAGTENAYEEITDATILPQELSAAAAADILSGDEVRTIVGDHHDLEILDVEVAPGAPVAGRTLADINLPRGSLVISGQDRCCIARGETELEAGERYIVGAESDVVDEVLGLFRG